MTDNEIIKALETCVKLEDCEKCPRYKNCEFFYDRDYVGVPDVLALSLDINKRQKAEIERLKGEAEEKTETIDFLKNQAVGWSIDFCNLKSKLDTAKSEAIKEFWNQRPPQLNPIQKGKELYNEGWNDCISFFAEEYEIFLGIKQRNEKDDCDDNLVKETEKDK